MHDSREREREREREMTQMITSKTNQSICLRSILPPRHDDGQTREKQEKKPGEISYVFNNERTDPVETHHQDEVPRRYRPPRLWRRRFCPHRPRLEDLGPFHGPRRWLARRLSRGGPRQDIQGVCGVCAVSEDWGINDA